MYMVQAGDAAGTKSLGSWLQAQGVMLLGDQLRILWPNDSEWWSADVVGFDKDTFKHA